jgi:hypothetical protein
VWVVMVLILAAVAVAVSVWQWRSPDAFGESGAGISLYNQVGTTALVEIAMPRRDMNPDVLTLHAAEPQVAEGKATVDVVVCHTGSERGDRLGAARGRVDRYCKPHEVPEGARVSPDDYLILRVRSDEPGDVVVDGLKLTYSHGWRRGSEETGSTVEVKFGTESVSENLHAH